MANKDAAFGFKPTRHLTGGLIRTEEYAIAANYGTAIYTGQVVEAVAGGGIEAAAAGDTQQAGVFGGVFYTDPDTSKPTFKPFYKASTNASDLKASVHADPYIIYEAQHDGTGTAAMNNSAFDFVGGFPRIALFKSATSSDPITIQPACDSATFEALLIDNRLT